MPILWEAAAEGEMQGNVGLEPLTDRHRSGAV